MRNRKMLCLKFWGLLFIITLGLKNGFALSFLDEPKNLRAGVDETTFKQKCSELFLDFITEYYSILASGNDEFGPNKSFDETEYVFKDTESKQSSNGTVKNNDTDSQLHEIVSELLSFNPSLANVVLQYIGQRKNLSASTLGDQNNTSINFDTIIPGDVAEILRNLTTSGNALKNMNPFILTSKNLAARSFDKILRKKREVHLILDYMLDVLEDIIMGLRRSADVRLNKELVRILRQSRDFISERKKRQFGDQYNLTTDEEHGSWGQDSTQDLPKQITANRIVTDNVRGTLGETMGLFFEIFNALADRSRFEMHPNSNTMYIEGLIDRLFPKLVVLNSQTSNPHWESNAKDLNTWDKSESQIHNEVVKPFNGTTNRSMDINASDVLDELILKSMNALNGTKILSRVKRVDSSLQSNESLPLNTSTTVTASTTETVSSLVSTKPSEQSSPGNLSLVTDLSGTRSSEQQNITSNDERVVTSLVKNDVGQMLDVGNITTNNATKENKSKRQLDTGYKPVIFVSTVDSSILSKERNTSDAPSNSKIDDHLSANRGVIDAFQNHSVSSNLTSGSFVGPNISNSVMHTNLSETRSKMSPSILDDLTVVYLNRSTAQAHNTSSPGVTVKDVTLTPPSNLSTPTNFVVSDVAKPVPASPIISNDSTKSVGSPLKTDSESPLLASSIPQSFLNDSSKPANNILAVVGDSIKSIIGSVGESVRPVSTLTTMNGSQQVTGSPGPALSKPMDLLIASISQAAKESSSANPAQTVLSNLLNSGNGTRIPSTDVILNSNSSVTSLPSVVNQSAQVSAFLEKLRTEISKSDSSSPLKSTNDTVSPLQNPLVASTVSPIKNESKSVENIAPVISTPNPPGAHASSNATMLVEPKPALKSSNETTISPKEIPANQGQATELMTEKSKLHEASDKLVSKQGLLPRESVKFAREIQQGNVREYAGLVVVLVVIGLIVVASVFMWRFSSESQDFDSENLTIREPICPSPPRAGGMNNFNYATNNNTNNNNNSNDSTTSARTCGRPERESEEEVRTENLRASQMIELTPFRKPDIPV